MQLHHCRNVFYIVPWVWFRLSPCFAELKHKIHYQAIQNMLLPKVELAWDLKTSKSHYTVSKNRVHHQHKTAFMCWIFIAYLEKGQSSLGLCPSTCVCLSACLSVCKGDVCVYSCVFFAEKQFLVMLEFHKSRFLHPHTKTPVNLIVLN